MGSRKSYNQRPKAPIYRLLEKLTAECLVMADRCPGGVGIRRLTERLIDALADAMTAVDLALTTEDARAKLELIEALRIETRLVKTLLDQIYAWSSGNGRVRLLTDNQLARMAEPMEEIAVQLRGWASKTASQQQTLE